MKQLRIRVVIDEVVEYEYPELDTEDETWIAIRGKNDVLIATVSNLSAYHPDLVYLADEIREHVTIKQVPIEPLKDVPF